LKSDSFKPSRSKKAKKFIPQKFKEEENLLKIRGYEIELSGRLKLRIKKPQPITQLMNIKWGHLAKKRARNSNLKYSFDSFANSYGKVGVKVWINYDNLW
jgi:ribosomal protein S3